jgi:hypothetical protein
VDFWALFRHESGSLEYKVHGFWDGDGVWGARAQSISARPLLPLLRSSGRSGLY